MKLSPSLRSALWAVWALAVAGFLGGVAWKLVAPLAKIRIQANGGYYVDPSPRQYVEADAWFTGISLLVAVVAGLVVWRRLRDRPTAAVWGLALGGGAASTLIWAVGKYLGRLDRAAALKAKVGTVVSDSLDLGAKGLLVLLPIAAVATWLVLDLATQHRHRPSPASAVALGPGEPQRT